MALSRSGAVQAQKQELEQRMFAAKMRKANKEEAQKVSHAVPQCLSLSMRPCLSAPLCWRPDLMTLACRLLSPQTQWRRHATTRPRPLPSLQQCP